MPPAERGSQALRRLDLRCRRHSREERRREWARDSPHSDEKLRAAENVRRKNARAPDGLARRARASTGETKSARRAGERLDPAAVT